MTSFDSLPGPPQPAPPAKPLEKLSGPAYWAKCWTRSYADFSGRSRRAEFGWFVLVNAIISTALLAVALVSLMNAETDLEGFPLIGSVAGIAYLLFTVAQIVPFAAVSVRRWHDVGMSGWLALLYLPAMFISIGALALVLVQTFQDSKPEANEWGPSPKYG